MKELNFRHDERLSAASSNRATQHHLVRIKAPIQSPSKATLNEMIARHSNKKRASDPRMTPDNQEYFYAYSLNDDTILDAGTTLSKEQAKLPQLKSN